jgi:hypothetical protein
MGRPAVNRLAAALPIGLAGTQEPERFASMSTFQLVMKTFTITGIAALLAGATGCNVTPFLPGFLLPNASVAGRTTTIIIVRHAERDSPPDNLDPPLNAEGLIRREALRNALKERGVTAIYTADLLRNRQTVELLEAELGLKATLIGAAELAVTKPLADRLVTEWRTQHAGGVVLWVGNTGPFIENVQDGNLEEVYRRLGGTGTAPNRYQDMYIVVVPESGPAHFIKTTYGGPSSLD